MYFVLHFNFFYFLFSYICPLFVCGCVSLSSTLHQHFKRKRIIKFNCCNRDYFFDVFFFIDCAVVDEQRQFLMEMFSKHAFFAQKPTNNNSRHATTTEKSGFIQIGIGNARYEITAEWIGLKWKLEEQKKNAKRQQNGVDKMGPPYRLQITPKKIRNTKRSMNNVQKRQCWPNRIRNCLYTNTSVGRWNGDISAYCVVVLAHDTIAYNDHKFNTKYSASSQKRSHSQPPHIPYAFSFLLSVPQSVCVCGWVRVCVFIAATWYSAIIATNNNIKIN